MCDPIAAAKMATYAIRRRRICPAYCSALTKRLFEAVRAAGPEHREALIDGLDPDLRKEVKSLLAAEDGSLLDKTPPAGPHG